MEFTEWLALQTIQPGSLWVNLAFQVKEDKSFPARPKNQARLLSYMKRLKYSKDMQRQARLAFRAWMREEKAPRDEFNARDRERVKRALRQAWSWSYSRRLCVERCTDERGFVYCENPECPHKGSPVPKIHVDHKNPVGSVDDGILSRMFVPSDQLQGLCGQCHGKKTRADNAKMQNAATPGARVGTAKKKRKNFTDEF